MHAVMHVMYKLFFHQVRWGTCVLDIQTDAGRHHPLVVEGVHTHAVVLQVEGKLAELDVLQLVFVQVGPAPEAGVNDMWETLAAGNLQTPI